MFSSKKREICQNMNPTYSSPLNYYAIGILSYQSSDDQYSVTMLIDKANEKKKKTYTKHLHCDLDKEAFASFEEAFDMNYPKK